MNRSSFFHFLIGLVLSLPAVGLAAKGEPSEERKDVSVKRKTEPFYPQWAYNNGIGEGYAKVAFYVDEAGSASEFLALEYSHQPFFDELMKVVTEWEFVPAHQYGKPIKSVCHAYWEFRPDRPIYTNALFDTSKRIEKSDASSIRELRMVTEEQLDAKPRMLYFPEIVAPPGFDATRLEDGKIAVSCTFFLDTQGQVALPTLLESSASELNAQVIAAFKQCFFEQPVSKGEPVVVSMRKTYLLAVSLTE